MRLAYTQNLLLSFVYFSHVCLYYLESDLISEIFLAKFSITNYASENTLIQQPMHVTPGESKPMPTVPHDLGCEAKNNYTHFQAFVGWAVGI